MELRHIRYFLAVAEEGNFTRAAARLGIGQPPLSLQIRDLEAEVGAALFRRLPHGAALTEAGQAFLEAVGPMPGQAADAVLRAQRAARGESGQLTLGFTGSVALNPLVPASIRAFRQRFPAVDLRVTEGNSVRLSAALQAQQLDVALLRPSESDPPELLVQRLLAEPLVAALPANHAAARAPASRNALSLRTLRGDAFILTAREVGLSLHDSMLAACREAGFEPLRGPTAPQIALVLSLVSAEMGVALLPASARQLSLQGVVYRPLRQCSVRVGLAVAHRRGPVSQMVLNFAQVAQAVARQAAGETVKRI